MTASKFADDDLHDLIAGEEQGRDGSEMKPLNLEHLSQGELDVPVRRTNNYAAGHNPCIMLCCAYLAYCCDCAPRLCFCLGLIAIVVPAYVLVMTVFFNPTEHFGVPNDYTGITSPLDLTIGKIDHWCLNGDNTSCRCEDPLTPQPRGEFRAWSRAQVANMNYVKALIADGKGSPDIAFVGSSVVEAMGGKWFGRESDENLKSLKKIFDKNFQTQSGADLDAVSLGIAGDTNPTVLWRLIHGEMPDDFNPKIWWLELGMNDLGRSQCSEEVVVLGVLRIVEEILEKKKDAIVVINSLLPLADIRGGLKPGDNDFKDGFDKNSRTKSTAKIEKIEKAAQRKKEGKNSNKIDKDADDAGDTTHIDNLKDDDGNKKKGKKESKAGKNTGTGETTQDSKKGKGDGRMLAVAQSELRLLKKEKPVRMKANIETQKKFNPITHKERSLPLWTSITSVNKALRRFAGKNDKNVLFFDATDIFTEREDNDIFLLKTDLISIRGHPSPKGFEAWEKAIVERAKSILKSLNENQPPKDI